MVVQIKLFGIAAESAGQRTIELEVSDQCDLFELKRKLQDKFPTLESIVPYSVAVNRAYAKQNISINQNDELALIPPVSGG